MNSINSTNSTVVSLHLGSNEASKANNDNLVNVEIKPEKNQQTESTGLPKDKVSISAEAEKIQREEKENANVDASDNAKKKSIMELADEMKQKIIDDLKDRIKELTEKLQQLEAQGNESAKEQAKLLQRQITDLNAQLLTVMSS